MKTTLAIFLLCATVMVGQDYEPKLIDYLQPHATNVTLKQDALQLLVDEYEQYEKECYADSTLQRVHEPPVAFKTGERIIYEGCLVDWECIVESHYKNKWIHKETNFEGFMAWLKKKLK